MRKLIKLVFLLVAVIVIGAVAIVFYIDRIAKAAIERGSTYALGVPTSIENADVHLLRGGVDLDDLEVGNPQGFKTSHFLTLEDGHVEVALASLRQDVVEVPVLSLEGIDLNLEKQKGKSNYQVILDNLKRLESEKPAEGKRYVIREVIIRDVMVHVDMIDFAPGDLAKLNAPIDEIRLKNVGSESKRGVLLSELSGVIIKALLAAVADKAGDIMPGDISGELKRGLANLEGLDKLADIESLGKLGDVLGDTGGKAKEEIDKAVGGLKDLLGGDKDK